VPAIEPRVAHAVPRVAHAVVSNPTKARAIAEKKVKAGKVDAAVPAELIQVLAVGCR
jgi:hypothetical protein